jgi:hypothetical protein
VAKTVSKRSTLGNDLSKLLYVLGGEVDILNADGHAHLCITRNLTGVAV